MHTELARKLGEFARERVDDVLNSQDYSAMSMSMMNTELMLGDAERDYDPNDPNQKGFISGLDEAWALVCEAAISKAASLAEDSPEFARNLSLSPGALQAALYDNYLFGALAAAFAAHTDDSIRAMPALAWAAYNKHAYKGYRDEVACLRMLLWAGFDPDAQDEQGMTALHYMASLKHSSYSHPRAVGLLLEAGADPNLQNVRGDTPLCYLSGNARWTDNLNITATMLLSADADSNRPAADGATPLSLMQASNALHPHEDRSQLIAELMARYDAAALGGVPEAAASDGKSKTL